MKKIIEHGMFGVSSL